MRARQNTAAENAPVRSPDDLDTQHGDMTEPDSGSAAESQLHGPFAMFDLASPFGAVRSLIQRYAEDTDAPVTLDDVTAFQLSVMVSWGMAAAILAEMAATTGRVLREWFPLGGPLDQLLAGLDSTTAQPGWSPWPESALAASKHIVADYVSSPRLHDSSIDQITALGGAVEHAEILNAGVMMCLELLHSASQIRGDDAR
jgi:hypothetical protein